MSQWISPLTFLLQIFIVERIISKNKIIKLDFKVRRILKEDE